MKVQVFAMLKEYFSEKFEVADMEDLEALRRHLEQLNPNSKSILDRCRFAVGGAFVPMDTKIERDETVYVMPPSSGG